ncbi:MAG: signal recognition particle-docking protein FtsY [Aquificaceae bacterium]
MALFWKKSQEEKAAERGDKTNILKLIEKGKINRAIDILERFKDDKELRPILYELYIKTGKYYYAYQLIEHYDRNLGTAKERALIYEKVGERDKAIEEYQKVGDFESLYRAGLLVYELERKEDALRLLERSTKLAPPSKRQEIEESIKKIKQDIGLLQIKKESLLEKIRNGLKKTKESALFGIILRGRKVDEELFEELEEMLIRADIGTKIALSIIENLKKEAIRRNIKESEGLKSILSERFIGLLSECSKSIEFKEGRPNVYLFLGVNGSGKTTTIGKLAYKFILEGKKVLLCAGDTFRSAAIEQLEVWAKRSGADIVKKEEGADPAAVVYDAMKKLQEGYDLLLIDTAGRLHTKEPLVRELRKIKATVQRFLPDEPTETFLVLDATLGQNSISQAKVFKDAVDVSGIVLTKLDGTSKGGAIIPICQELKIPVKLLGVGEAIDDLQPLHSDIFVEELLS